MVEESTRRPISYRRAGGMAGLDQRMTVHADGRVVMEDRKSRNRSEIQASAAELANLYSLTESVPAHLWHGALTTLAQHLLPRPHESLRFEVHSAQGRITGNSGRADADLAPLLAQLDELLARAVRERRASG